jgi:4-amino-4-deoxy-L-arabinose transferase-like glycosyltransferase
MSADLDILLSHPDQILWNPEPNEALRQTYRELDAPLTRYLIGLGRRGGGFAELPSDWVWGKSWSANAQAGALPSNGLLLSARLAVAWLFPISLLLIYAGCRRVGHAWVGWIACMILAFHPLVLLHTRRAMAESALFFGAALVIAILPSLRIRPWMAGLAGALALNAKQSALGLLPAAALACTWVEGLRTMKPARIGFRLVEFLACLFLFTFLLNPYLWQDPISAASAAAAARADLFTRQSADFHVSPATNIAAIAQQVIVTLGQVYLAPPQFEEVGNYIADTAGQKAAYLANPLNDLLQSPIWGGLFLFFTLFGVILSFYRIRRLEPANQRWMILLALATVGEFLVLAVALPLPYQRYVIPLLPLLCIWAALGVEGMVRSLLTHRKENPTG